MEKLTTAQAAARSGASRFAIHRAVKSGALHPVRDNRGRYLFDAEELDAWSVTRAHLVAQSLRDDSATEAAPAAAQSELDALRDRLTDAETRARVAETQAEIAKAVAAERLDRIEDLRIALAATRWRWPWESKD